ncbi:MAG: hypothetical protein VX246_12685 [Myxococcota bacterium]|nr:hypothetical protein [Myxococcota bacterium]
MVRTSTFVALIAGMALALGLAGSASANSSVDIIWANSGTATTGTVSSAPPPTLSALVILRGDTPEGIGGVFVSILFDYVETAMQDPDPACQGTCEIRVFNADGNELDADGPPYAIENSGKAAEVGMGNQFSPLSGGVTLDQESDGADYGSIVDFDSSTGLSDGCVACTVTLGSVHFSTNMLETDLNPDVVAAVLPNGIDTIVSAFSGSSGGAEIPDSRVDWGAASILPEPMAGAFGLAALGTLGLLARRRR